LSKGPWWNNIVQPCNCLREKNMIFKSEIKDRKHTLFGGTPSHGLLSVQSSHIITPRLKISHFSVTGSLRISSGAIHSGVPADEESLIGMSVITLESPKSQILIVLWLFTRQFALLRSRWTIFIRCMHINPLGDKQKNKRLRSDQSRAECQLVI